MPSKEFGDPPPEDTYDAFSSPPCYAHEVDPAYLGLKPAVDLASLQNLQRTLRAAVCALQSIRFS